MNHTVTKNPHRPASWIGTMLALICLLGLGGCARSAASGLLQVQSLSDDPIILSTNFTSSVFDHDPHGETSFWLSDVPVDDLLSGRVEEGQIVHVELLWIPRAGSTPMDSSATNASIRYIVISRGQVGIYIGAGFARPHGKLSRKTISISMHEASLKLGESTEGFNDLLSPARLSGRFSARNDAAKTRQLRISVSQFVTDALGRTRFVLDAPSVRTPDKRLSMPASGLAHN